MVYTIPQMLLQSSLTSQSIAAAQSLPISVIPWFPLALIVALVVMGVAVIIYMLAPIMNSSAMKEWAVYQIYEAALSIGLIIVFLGIAALLLINPQTFLGSTAVNLVPTGCTTTNTIYVLSVCDLAQFNNASYSLVGYLYWLVFLKSIVPAFNVTVNPLASYGYNNVGFAFTIPNPLDLGLDWTGRLLTYINDAILVLLLLNQVQLILLSSSLFLLSFFFALGLITRIFGFSRSFGGAMLAFGIGLGILFPLMTAMTYGFVDVQANTNCIQSAACSICATASYLSTSSANTATAGSCFVSALLTGFLSPFGSVNAAAAAGGVVAGGVLQPVGAALATVFREIGYILSGLILLPVFNIMVVDVFIADFSKAVGEPMSFATLFKRLI